MADETEVEIVVRLQAVEVRDLYPEISEEDPSSRVCMLCTTRLKDKTHNLTRHLERHHVGALVQLMEQRGQASPSFLATKVKRAQQEKVANKQVQDDEIWELKAQSAKVALARWLAHEQLPTALVDSYQFQEFMGALNEKFHSPQRREVQQLLGSLVHRGRVANECSQESGEDDAMSDDDGNRGADKPSPIEMMALCSISRCDEDSPLVAFHQITCDVVSSGEAKVRIHRATASLFDLHVCTGQILGKNGVLGKSFIGTVQALNQQNTEVLRDTVELHQRVIASTYRSVESSNRDVPDVLGVSASCGALAEYIVLPIENLYAVPSILPDDIALLSDDHATIMGISHAITTRSLNKIAIVTDEMAMCTVGLLVRYFHHVLHFSQDDIHVFATTSMSSSPLWNRYATITSLDIYQPSELDDVFSQQLAFDGCVEICGTEASSAFAIKLIQPMGCLVCVDRSRFELEPATTVAMDMNSVVVNELEIVSLHDCSAELPAALQYLSEQAQDPDAVNELRTFLSAPVELCHVHEELCTSSAEDRLKLAYLQVVIVE